MVDRQRLIIIIMSMLFARIVIMYATYIYMHACCLIPSSLGRHRSSIWSQSTCMYVFPYMDRKNTEDSSEGSSSSSTSVDFSRLPEKMFPAQLLEFVKLIVKSMRHRNILEDCSIVLTTSVSLLRA